MCSGMMIIISQDLEIGLGTFNVSLFYNGLQKALGAIVRGSCRKLTCLLVFVHLVLLLPADAGALHQCGCIKVLDRSPASPQHLQSLD